LRLAGIDLADVEPVGIGVPFEGADLAHHDAREGRRGRMHFLDFEPGHGQGMSELLGVFLRIDEGAQPAFGKFHLGSPPS
jgi:hypothetical protein